MSIDIDFTAGCAYVWIGEKGSGQILTACHVTDAVLVDVDDEDNPVGVEVIGLKTEIPIGRLVRDYDIPDQTIRELLSISGANLSVVAAGTPKPTVTVEETTHLSDCAMWSGVLHEPCTCAAGTDTTSTEAK